MALADAAPGDHLAVDRACSTTRRSARSRTSGAGGPLLETVLERLLAAAGVGVDERLPRARRARSCVSADKAHAVHPNYPERHDPAHRPLVNHGPVVKINANQRYATDAATAVRFAGACARGRACRCSCSCRATTCRADRRSARSPPPASASPTVDVGVPQLSMHSARELCGTADPLHLARALHHYWT